MSVRVGDLYLGKTDHTHDPRDLLLTRYTTELTVPAGPLGHAPLLPHDTWGMLGNDGAGDCVWAGGDHEEMLWAAESGKIVSFTTDDALGDYSACTGYNPDDPTTDRGTDMRNAMTYRRKTGLQDSRGRRHKIEAFAALAAGDLNHVKTSIWLFSVASVGIQFPVSAMDQFNAGKPWTVVRNSKVEGGHYVPVVYWDPDTGWFWCVTWGRIQLVAPQFFATYMDEGFSPLSAAPRKRGKTLEGFDYTQLKADLKAIAA